MVLEDGFQVWNALVRVGLEETRVNDLPGYDADLVRELTQRLYPHATQSLEDELRAAPPSTEAFLEVFFAALRPLSQMLRGVLNMFEAAGARRTDENLRIVFNFDKASQPLTLTLNQFRDTELYFRRVARPIVVRQWNTNTLWALKRDVDSVLESFGETVQRRFDAAVPVRQPRIREWVERNGKPGWLPFPGLPRSGDPELDEMVVLSEGLIHFMMAEVTKLGATYQEFTRRLNELPREEAPWDEGDLAGDDPADDLPRGAFVRAAHDFWPNSFAEDVCLAIETVQNRAEHDRGPSAARFVEAIRTGFERPPRHERTVVSLEQDFRELINLPIWKKRHEVYAVWVASRIADSLSDLSWEWHPDGDTLRFSFAGTELAALRTIDGGMHMFWTEKRTPLLGGGIWGRKHIQPDYRIMTVPTHRDEATSLVVECKQYRKWSKRNFGTALDDYAKGCPAAIVVLVNYGIADGSLLEVVDPSRRGRTFLVGEFRPGNDDALGRFREVVRGAYAAIVTPRITGAIDVELRWGQRFRDLDLHLFIRSVTGQPLQHVGLGAGHGSLIQAPWAAWHEDVRSSPPGIERITIARWLDADYDVLVHDYSGVPDFPEGDVSLRLVSSLSADTRSFAPGNGTGRWWHVCRVRGASGQIDEINSVHQECPFAVP